MKLPLVLALGSVAMLITSGCHKKPVAASTPPAPRPAAHESPAPAPQRQQPAAVSTPKSTPAPSVAATRSSKALEDYLNKLLDAYFDYDKANLRNDAQTALSSDSGELRSLLQEFPNTKLVVEGDCDERGSPEYNLALGERRAKVAQEFLTQIGVPAERLTTISYGQERPVCREHNEECWQKNRRAHLTASQ